MPSTNLVARNTGNLYQTLVGPQNTNAFGLALADMHNFEVLVLSLSFFGEGGEGGIDDRSAGVGIGAQGMRELMLPVFTAGGMRKLRQLMLESNELGDQGMSCLSFDT